jgi:hypothetical protein
VSDTLQKFKDTKVITGVLLEDENIQRALQFTVATLPEKLFRDQFAAQLHRYGSNIHLDGHSPEQRAVSEFITTRYVMLSYMITKVIRSARVPDFLTEGEFVSWQKQAEQDGVPCDDWRQTGNRYRSALQRIAPIRLQKLLKDKAYRDFGDDIWDWAVERFEDFPLEALPPEIHLYASGDVVFQMEDDSTVFDKLKLKVEGFCGVPLNWWPLRPIKHPLEPGQSRISWKCVRCLTFPLYKDFLMMLARKLTKKTAMWRRKLENRFP